MARVPRKAATSRAGRRAATYRPAHLGKQSSAPCAQIDRIPWTGGREILINLECSEFSSLCPVTGQPDFGHLRIAYVPAAHIVETKSLKLYLWQFRDRGAFNEDLVVTIAEDLYSQLQPKWIEVTGRFNSRGGISVTATARRPSI